MMDENSKKLNMKTEKETVCQFYIVLGHHDRIFQNNDENRYFPVNENMDVNLIQYALGEEWKKKKKDNIKVANEIIFLIPDLSYKDTVKELMDKLNCRGKFQVVRPIVKEPEVVDKVEKDVNIDQLSKEEFKMELEQQKTERNISLPDNLVEEKEIDINEVKKEEKDDNVFHGDFPRKVVDYKDTSNVKDYMWGEEKGKNLMLNKKRKIDLPVIIFIVALIILIVAGILLFVLK